MVEGWQSGHACCLHKGERIPMNPIGAYQAYSVLRKAIQAQHNKNRRGDREQEAFDQGMAAGFTLALQGVLDQALDGEWRTSQ
jgi:hypothetical protein